MNVYTQNWKKYFLQTRDPELTQIQVNFLKSVFPKLSHNHLIDLGAGYGRHAIPLARDGYHILAIDNDHSSLEKLHENARNEPEDVMKKLTLKLHDMRDLQSIEGTFDGIYSMWQSFGYYDYDTNNRILIQMVDLLESNGRIVFDLFNLNYYLLHNPGQRRIEIGNNVINERTELVGRQLQVALNYPEGTEDDFAYYLYSVESLSQILRDLGLRRVGTYVWFKQAFPTQEDPRFQVVFEKQ